MASSPSHFPIRTPPALASLTQRIAERFGVNSVVTMRVFRKPRTRNWLISRPIFESIENADALATLLDMTKRLKPDEYLQAAEILKAGGTVVIPTETVYGIGADATSEMAIKAIFAAKGRPSDNPLIIHLRFPDQLQKYCRNIPKIAYRFIEVFCPGPLTLVLPKKSMIVDGVTAGLDTVAVRFPSHLTAQKILEATGLPIAAPSANLSGRPSATTWQAAIEDLDGRVDAVVCDFPTEIGLESTVVDLSVDIPVILRSGAITLEQLRSIEPSIAMRTNSSYHHVNSPGLRHKHYQPRARVVLCDSASQMDANPQEKVAYIGLELLNSTLTIAMSHPCVDLVEYARTLFDFFRQCDAASINTIWCQRVDETGLGCAIMDRLRRAAETD